MSNKSKINSKISQNKVLDEIIISEPEKIVIILHEKKKEILNCIFKSGKNIQEIKDITGINPGTIKRHLTDLERNGLVFIESIKRNDYNIKMKYYRAIAQKFKIQCNMP